jgi:hypothetical protein
LTAPKLLLLLALALAPALPAQFLSDFVFVSDTESGPSGANPGYIGFDRFSGNMHSNDRILIEYGAFPLFQGAVSSSACTVQSAGETELPEVFQGGLTLGQDRIRLPDPQEILELADLALPEHDYPASIGDSSPLTTWIKLDHTVYHVSQYQASLVQGPDTSYTLPWQTRPLPADPRVIRVRGVARVQGIVQGQLTLVAEDSLFLTGDVITADVILEPCGSFADFGTVPAGSGNRIGLIGLKDVLIAATAANGLGGWNNTNSWDCPSPYEPVVRGCGQTGNDIILTASILALGCSFGVEYWITANDLPVFWPPIPQQNCEGMQYTHFAYLNCSDFPGFTDSRGTIRLHGSVACRVRGDTRSGLTFHPSTVGYHYTQMRHDPNLLVSPPPFWPLCAWIDDDPPGITLSEAGQAWCGTVTDTQQFREQWDSGAIRLLIQPSALALCDNEQLRLGVFLDGTEVAHRDTVLQEDMTLLEFIPEFDLPAGGFNTVHLEASWDRQRWNEGGEECLWELQFTDLADEPRTRPHTLGLTAYPNPFNPGTTVTFETRSAGTARLGVYDVTGRRVRTLVLETPTAGVHRIPWDGTADSGEHAPTGVYLLDLIGPGDTRETAKVLLVR